MAKGGGKKEGREGKTRTFWKSPKAKGKVRKPNGDPFALPPKETWGCWALDAKPAAPAHEPPAWATAFGSHGQRSLVLTPEEAAQGT